METGSSEDGDPPSIQEEPAAEESGLVGGLVDDVRPMSDYTTTNEAKYCTRPENQIVLKFKIEGKPVLYKAFVDKEKLEKCLSPSAWHFLFGVWDKNIPTRLLESSEEYHCYMAVLYYIHTGSFSLRGWDFENVKNPGKVLEWGHRLGVKGIEEYMIPFLRSSAGTLRSSGAIDRTVRNLYGKKASSNSKDLRRNCDDCIYCAEGDIELQPRVFWCGSSDCESAYGAIVHGEKYYTYESGTGGDTIYRCSKCIDQCAGRRRPQEVKLGTETVKVSKMKKIEYNDKKPIEGMTKCDLCGHKWHDACALHNSLPSFLFICPLCEYKLRGGGRGPGEFGAAAPKTAKDLEKTHLSEHLHKKILGLGSTFLNDLKAKARANRERNRPEDAKEIEAGVKKAQDSTHIRVLSARYKTGAVPKPLRKVFGYDAETECNADVDAKAECEYRQICIGVFQNRDGCGDVFVVVVYLHLYFNPRNSGEAGVNLSYLDSVPHMTGKSLIIPELLGNCLDYLRCEKFRIVHVWQCALPSPYHGYFFHFTPNSKQWEEDKRTEEAWATYKKTLDKNLRQTYSKYYARFMETGVVQQVTNMLSRFESRKLEFMVGDFAHKMYLEEYKSKTDAAALRELRKDMQSEKENLSVLVLKVPTSVEVEKHRNFKDKCNEAKIKDELKEDVISGIFDNREDALEHCRENHFQFDDIRRNMASTMALLWRHFNPEEQQRCCSFCDESIYTSYFLTCTGTDRFSCLKRECHQKLADAGDPNIPKLAKLKEEPELLPIDDYFEAIRHVCPCKAENCDECKKPLFAEMKLLIEHYDHHFEKQGCNNCRRLDLLYQKHSRDCPKANCKFPECITRRQQRANRRFGDAMSVVQLKSVSGSE